MVHVQALYRPIQTLSLLLSTLVGQTQLHYTLSYTDTLAGKVAVTIRTDTPMTTPITWIMPRSIPGAYSMLKYDGFIEHLQANAEDGSHRPFVKSRFGAPRWSCADSNFRIVSISYDVDIAKMDDQIHAASDKSILRKDFAGLLNYSVFGWIEGRDLQRVDCTIETFSKWPVFSTLAPTAAPAKGRLEWTAVDYYSLADGQTFIGPAFRVKEYKGLVPLFVADYREGPDEELDDYAWQEAKSMEILKDYFGRLPFPYYTILLRHAIPHPDDESGSFAMEHLQSSTFFGDTAAPRTRPLNEQERLRSLPTYLHHMAHAFIPLRCYGDTYRPHVMEIPPVIHNVWFNEGFMWYIVYDTLKQKDWLDFFQSMVYNASPDIKNMSLQQLSETASLQYADDFRLGTGIYSRGALMAYDIDRYVKSATSGRTSMKTIYRYLYEWSIRNQRPFTMQEFPGLLKDATGVDVSGIYEKWQRPIGN